ncbi:hypothetical protein QO190_13100 [Cloacibacterium sp. Arc13]
MKLEKLKKLKSKDKLTKEVMSKVFGGFTVYGSNCSFTGYHECGEVSLD